MTRWLPRRARWIAHLINSLLIGRMSNRPRWCAMRTRWSRCIWNLDSGCWSLFRKQAQPRRPQNRKHTMRFWSKASASVTRMYARSPLLPIPLMVTMNANLDRRQVEVMERLLQSGQPTIGIAVYNPYDLLAFPQLRTYLATYEYTQPALEAAVRVLFGEIQSQGHLPVSLDI